MEDFSSEMWASRDVSVMIHRSTRGNLLARDESSPNQSQRCLENLLGESAGLHVRTETVRFSHAFDPHVKFFLFISIFLECTEL